MVNIYNIRVSEIRGSEIRGSKIRVSKIRGSEIRVSEIRVSKIRGSEIRVSAIRVSEIRISSNQHELHGAIFFPGDKGLHQLICSNAHFCLNVKGIWRILTNQGLSQEF